MVDDVYPRIPGDIRRGPWRRSQGLPRRLGGEPRNGEVPKAGCLGGRGGFQACSPKSRTPEMPGSPQPRSTPTRWFGQSPLALQYMTAFLGNTAWQGSEQKGPFLGRRVDDPPSGRILTESLGPASRPLKTGRTGAPDLHHAEMRIICSCTRPRLSSTPDGI